MGWCGEEVSFYIESSEKRDISGSRRNNVVRQDPSGLSVGD